ncbi:cistern family PEP-CTERM protein [Sphingomonas floccifaciens]|uniref:Cistern family PEP-CTERM protein n=1 Tax=Sphingomonas floccifaciens TaxID=1844115 RepID=A0ABW4NDR8_9SPHN
MIKFAAISALALLASTPVAQAASIVSGNTVSLDRTNALTWTTSFAGTDGAAAVLTFNYTGANAAGTAWNFTYSVDNTSVSPSLAARLGVFGFDTSGTPASVVVGANNSFGASAGGNFNGLGNRDVCFFTGSNCNGSGNSGVTVSDMPVSGAFTLNYATGQTNLTVDNFAARWQAAGANNNLSLSATGTITSAVPEPATWAMMMLGFGVVGYGMRRRTAVRFATA